MGYPGVLFWLILSIFANYYTCATNPLENEIGIVGSRGIKLPTFPTACPKGVNSQICSNNGNCDYTTGNCQCFNHAIGTACQFLKEMMVCGAQRFCVQCRVHGTGAFFEDDGCNDFCLDHPEPVVVSQLTLRKNEQLCSFIDSDTSNSSTSCRFYFKLINIPKIPAGNHYADDVFVIAQRKQECTSNLERDRYFPQSALEGSKALNEEEQRYKLRDEDNTSETSYGYATLVFLAMHPKL